MSVGKEESLSPDEMRQKLYQTFKSRGLLDTLKTQLRNQLIQELQQPARGRDAVLRSAAAATHTNSVLVAACNSVIVDHLQTIGCEYTLSVFYPECAMSKDQILSTRDLLQLMKISPHTPLYKAVLSNIQRRQTGFLMGLFMELADHHIHGEHSDAATQTSTEPAHQHSLVEKMQLIEQEYEVLRSRGDRWASVEAKLAEYRKEIQEQSEMELKAKLQHFMDVEIAKVKREEQEKSRKEILELRRDMDRTYELKSEALMSREKNAIERLQKQQEMEEKEVYAQRQVLLKDIESVRNREAELKHRTEAFEKTCKLHEEKMKTMDDLLRRRELSVKTMEDSFEQKLKSELMKYQLELKDDYRKRTEKLTENEKKIKDETIRLQKEFAVVDAKAEEHERNSSEMKHLLMELESVREQTLLLSQQKKVLQEKLENMNDYPELKKQTLELQTHIRLLRQQLQENREENQHLRQELSAPSKEQLQLQAELQRLQTARRLDEDEFEAQKNVLQTQLQHEAQQCALLKGQLLECEERIRWMSTNAEEIKLQLQHTHQALENEILRNPKPSLVDRSVLSLNPDKLVPPDMYVESALLRRVRGTSDGDLSEAGVALRGLRHQWPRGEAPEQDSDLVGGALARIRELEKEAERLEEAYRSHQHRAIQAAAARVVSSEDLTGPRTTTSYMRPTAAAAQHRVTFAGAQPPLASVYSERENEQLMRTPPGDQTPLRLSSPPPRRLSSTPIAVSKTRNSADADEAGPALSQDWLRKTSDADKAPALNQMFTDLSTDRQISPISSRDLTRMSSPSSPVMKSTTRNNCSPPKLQQIISSSSQESSPQPEKISLHDLTDLEPFVSADQECVLEKQQDIQTQRCLEEEDVPSPETPEEEEERRPQERLEQELEMQYGEDSEERHNKEQHVMSSPPPPITDAVEEPEEASAGVDGVNPMEKYMMMLMQGKQNQQEQSPNKESEPQSAQEIVLSENSIDAVSHEEPDDFW